MLLNFGDRTRIGMFNKVWPLLKEKSTRCSQAVTQGSTIGILSVTNVAECRWSDESRCVQYGMTDAKRQQHAVFSSGYASKYYPRPMLLNFGGWTGTGMLKMVWPLLKDNSTRSPQDVSGHLFKYNLRPVLLSLGDGTRTGVFKMAWLLLKVNSTRCSQAVSHLCTYCWAWMIGIERSVAVAKREQHAMVLNHSSIQVLSESDVA